MKQFIKDAWDFCICAFIVGCYYFGLHIFLVFLLFAYVIAVLSFNVGEKLKQEPPPPHCPCSCKH